MNRPLALDRRPFLDDSAVDLPTLRRNVRNRALLTLWTGSVATAALALLSLVNAGGAGRVYEDIFAVLSAISASLALLVMTRRPGEAGLRYGSLAAAIAATALAMATLDLVPLLGQSAAAAIATACLAAGSAIAMVAILPTLFRRLDRRAGLSAGMDATIMLLASTTVLLTL